MNLRLGFRSILAALILSLGGSVPLSAQLNPQLQGSPTDFLDLYQQSSQAMVKPEIMTVFDFSGSMQNLMFHPQYVNTDATDSGDESQITFTLNAGVAGSNTYTLTATSLQDSSVTSTATVTVTSTGASIAAITPTYLYGSGTQPYGHHPTGSTIYTSISKITAAGTGPFTNLQVTVYATTSSTSGTQKADLGIKWALSPSGTAPTSPTDPGNTNLTDRNGSTYTYSSHTWTTASWTPPAYDPGTAASVSASFTRYQGSAFSGATLVCLVKPDGTPVTATDAANAANPNGLTLYGIGSGASDVRNWVRAASHARFSYNNSGTTRTVDVPIPWKITNRNVNITNPLPSQTVLDQQVKVASNGTTKTYGSGQQVEMDLMYTFDHGSDVLSGTSSSTTTTDLSLVVYKNAYLTWLFTGKYQSSNSANAYYSPANSGKYIVFDAATGNLAAGQGTGNLAWGQGYGTFVAGDTIQMPQYSLSGVWQSDATVSASLNAVPALMRCQAVKRAAIQTWIQYQADVLWAFRFLDPSHEANSGNATTIDNNSQTTLTNAAGTITAQGYGGDSAWTLMNNTAAQGITSTSGNSVTGMQRIAALFPNGNTPLTYAMARGLAQFTDPNSVFNAAETSNGVSTTSQCMNHFLIVFTDGIDNNGSGTNNPNGTTPYVTKSGSAYVFNADTGNKAILGNTGVVNRSGGDWNMFTFAAMAAHMSDSTLGGQVAGTDYLAAWDPGSPGAAQKSGTPSAFIPFAIHRRNGTLFNHDHPITTMTVGVSLGGTTAPPATGSISPKWNLLLAAALGDPTVDAYPDVTQLTPFQWDASLNSGTGGRVSGSIFYFDGTNPDALSQDLNYAFQSAVNSSQINVTSNPNLPFIGSSLGEEILLGKFQPPQNGGVMWSGDLLMFPTTTDSNGNTVILDKTGNPTSTLNSTTAVWSGYNALLDNRRWDARKLYTRLPGADPTVAALTPFTYTGDTTSNPLLNYVAQDNPANYPAGGTNQQSLIEFLMGANLLDPTDSTPSLANRANIMGDIVDSAPAYLTYTFSDITLPTGSKLSLAGRNRFRIILVGTNQGWLEAFGETTQVNSVQPNPTSQPNTYVNLVTGEVDELWAFMPTDFLKYLDYLKTSTNSHKFMVDGTPDIYFLDLPSSSGGSGNGTYDGSNVAITPLSDTTHERAIALIGLREGGRSYYALNLHNPFVPTLQWSLVPDEASSIPQSRNLTGLSLATLQGIVANMGFSTCTPSIGRVLFNGVYKDVVFLGGGYSVPQVEANFTGAPKLGRSVLAIDVYSGNILAAVDLTSSNIGGSSVGPIANGLVPFEYFLGSGMAQRAYFLDMWGSLWCWGSKGTVSSSSTSNPGYRNFRLDTSELQAWSSDGTRSAPYGATGIRKVYHDANSTVASGLLSGPAYTTLPSPFLVGTFTGAGHTDSFGTTAIPTAVGIAMESGNRYDPLDFGTNLPANTRLTVVFDRQDSRAWSFDSASGPDTGINSDSYLLNAGKWGANGGISTTLPTGSAYISPGTSSYYLAPSSQGSTDFGYYVTFPDKLQDTTNTTVYHYSKGINPPMVVSGSLYYSYFTPTTADVCTGGSGFTYSNKICDVMNPVVSVPTPTGMICGSGWVGTWLNVASDFSMMGSVSVQQAGTISTANPTNPNQTITTMSSATYSGQGQSRFPKARVWRTVH